VVLFHIEHRCNGRWEAFGSGEGGGDDASVAALADLRRLAGGRLPIGVYRCIPAMSSATRWETLRLDPDGEIALTEEAGGGRIQ
jgi:hypothetical protein